MIITRELVGGPEAGKTYAVTADQDSLRFGEIPPLPKRLILEDELLPVRRAPIRYHEYRLQIDGRFHYVK